MRTACLQESFIRVELNSLPEIQSRYRAGMLDAAEALQPPFSILTRNKDESGLFEDKNCVGMVTDLYDREEAGHLRKLPYPVINISNWIPPVPGLIHVLGDDETIGRVAARHLLNRGYRSFIVIGRESVRFSQERIHGFSTTVKKAGRHTIRQILLPRFYPSSSLGPMGQIETRWPLFEPVLSGMELDAGCFSVTDVEGFLLLDILRLHFPERVHTTGIVGVDNQEPRRWMPGYWPSLTSVQPGCHALGWAVIRHLVDIVGKPPSLWPKNTARIPPEGVVRRASTGGYACADPLAARAGRWAWERIRSGHPPTLHDMARFSHLSVRAVQRQFTKHHGCGFREFLQRAQLDQACHLLRGTDLRVGEVSAACGFHSQSAFSRAFKRQFNLTPRTWRRQDRLQPDG